MTPQHAALQLLKHGTLTRQEFLEITGWSSLKARTTIDELAAKGLVVITAHETVGGERYWLPESFPKHNYEMGSAGRLRLKGR